MKGLQGNVAAKAIGYACRAQADRQKEEKAKKQAKEAEAKP